MNEPRRIEWLHSLPALLAISLGLIYGAGAITLYGQIRGEGINGIQAMALVPVEQILGRGIGYMVRDFGQVLIVVALLVAALGAGGGKLPAESSSSRKSGRAIAALIAAFLIFLLIQLPMKESLAYLVGLLSAALVASPAQKWIREHWKEGPRQAAGAFGAVFISYWIAMTIGLAYFAPDPLPHAKLVALNGPTLEGGLVTNSGNSWYIAQDDESVVAISARSVRRSVITYPKRKPEQSFIDWMLGLPPSNP